MTVEPANPFATPRALPADGVGYAASYGPPPAGPVGSRLVGHFSAGPVSPPRLQSVTGLSRALCGLLSLHVLAGTAGAAVAAWSALTYATLTDLPPDARLGPDVAAAALLVLTAALTAITGLLFMAWLFCAARNVERLGTPLRHDPGWAIAAWFVPFLNLVRPKRIVDDVWLGSAPTTRPGSDLRRLARPGIVTTWWTTWLAAGALSAAGSAHVVIGAVEAQLAAHHSGSPDVVNLARLRETQAVWSLWSFAASVAAACCAIVIVRRISSWQQLRAEAALPGTTG